MYWTYRRELVRREQSTEPDRKALDWDCRSKSMGMVACLQLFERTGDRSYATRVCERGDVGSCLLDTLDALAVPATHDQALAELGTQCTKGSASACAWRLEHLRTNPAPGLFPEAFLMGQRACIELHEPVACAASAKAAAGLGWTPSAERFDRQACTLGYEPSCQPDPVRALSEEAAPQLVGPTQLDQASDFRRPEPLPGRPRLPGEPPRVRR